MTIKIDILPKGAGVRTGYQLTRCLGLVIHWIGVCQARAEVIRGNFGRDELGTQFISDWNDGHIIQCVPEDEVCYHVGSASGYTALKKKLCGSANPNWFLVGIECCIGDQNIPGDYAATGKYMDLGRPSETQYRELVAFAADFLKRHGLTENDLYLHSDITGKACHVWFVKGRARWDKFRADVRAAMEGDNMTKEEVQVIARTEFWRLMGECEDAQAANLNRPVSPWADEAWVEAKACGVLDGTRPNAPMTREQYAVTLDRLGLLNAKI